MSSHFSGFPSRPHHFPWCPSGCQVGTCGNTSQKIQKLVDCSWSVASNWYWAGADATSVARHQPWSVVLTHLRDRAWGFERGAPRFLSPLRFGLWSSHHFQPQDNILVDKMGCARLNDFGFTSIASLNCTETSAAGFKGSHRWMAPELYGLNNEGISGLCTYGSDIFALGMVTIEVRRASRERLPPGLDVPFVPSLRCLLDKCRSQTIRLRRR